MREDLELNPAGYQWSVKSAALILVSEIGNGNDELVVQKHLRWIEKYSELFGRPKLMVLG